MQMALRATVVSKYSSTNEAVPAVRRERRTRIIMEEMTTGRRGILLLSTVAASQVNDSKTELLNKYLKKSEENKAKNDKERQDSYYKRNYKDYFDFVEGSLQGKKEEQLSESEKGILEWLRAHK